MLLNRQAGKAILITSCLALVFLFSYYYASSAFATMNAGVGLAANDASSSLDSDDPCGSGTCGPAKIAIIDPTFTATAYDNSFYNFLENMRVPPPEKS